MHNPFYSTSECNLKTIYDLKLKCFFLHFYLIIKCSKKALTKKIATHIFLFNNLHDVIKRLDASEEACLN